MSRVRRPARCSGPAAPEHREAAVDEDGHAGHPRVDAIRGTVEDVSAARRVARDPGRPRWRPGVDGRRRGDRHGKCEGGEAADEDLASGQLPSPSEGDRADGGPRSTTLCQGMREVPCPPGRARNSVVPRWKLPGANAALAELMAADAELEGRPFGPGPGDLATPPGHPPGEVGAGCLVIS